MEYKKIEIKEEPSVTDCRYSIKYDGVQMFFKTIEAAKRAVDFYEKLKS